MHSINEAAQKRRKISNGLCIVLVGTTLWLGATYMKLNNKSIEASQRLQYEVDENEALQREISRLEVVVSNGAFFQGDDEWIANEIVYYDIPLSEELQYYTYIRCVDLGIAEYYELILATMWQESNFNPELISNTNDYGLMQINKCNHDWLSKELNITDFLDPYQSIDAGTHIFASLLLKYEDPHKALMAYNFGEAGARKHWDRGIYTSSYSSAIAVKQEQILNKDI